MTPDENPAWKGVLDWVELKGNAVLASSVKQLVDDDPTTGTYTTIPVPPDVAQPSPDIISGPNLKTTRYNSNNPTAQMLSLQITWDAADQNFILYQSDVGSHPVGT